MLGKESEHNVSNDNRIRLVNFTLSKNHFVKRTWFQLKDIHTITCVSPDGITHTQIDHILADMQHHTNKLDVSAYNGAAFDFDHLL